MTGIELFSYFLLDLLMVISVVILIDIDKKVAQLIPKKSKRVKLYENKGDK